MALHKKTPIFIRIVTNDKQVVCINPLQLASFEIIDQARIKISGPKDSKEESDYTVTPTVRFYLPQGTAMSYSVGLQITQSEFDYICSTLLEFLYLNEIEFKAKSAAIAKAQMDEFVALSKENEEKLANETK